MCWWIVQWFAMVGIEETKQESWRKFFTALILWCTLVTELQHKNLWKVIKNPFTKANIIRKKSHKNFLYCVRCVLKEKMHCYLVWIVPKNFPLSAVELRLKLLTHAMACHKMNRSIQIFWLHGIAGRQFRSKHKQNTNFVSLCFVDFIFVNKEMMDKDQFICIQLKIPIDIQIYLRIIKIKQA